MICFVSSQLKTPNQTTEKDGLKQPHGKCNKMIDGQRWKLWITSMIQIVLFGWNSLFSFFQLIASPLKCSSVYTSTSEYFAMSSVAGWVCYIQFASVTAKQQTWSYYIMIVSEAFSLLIIFFNKEVMYCWADKGALRGATCSDSDSNGSEESGQFENSLLKICLDV